MFTPNYKAIVIFPSLIFGYSFREGEARLEMALHYRNPHPRPVNLPPKSYTKKEGKKSVGRAQEQLRRQSRPVYVKSIDTESGIKDGS